MQIEKRFSNWKTVLAKMTLCWIALTVADIALAYTFGPQLWVNASYFFGTGVKATVGIVMFTEGIVAFTAGLVWASGAMETVFQGSNLQTNPYFRRDDWKQRREQTEGENVAGKALMLFGAPILVAGLLILVVV